jgi:hypothetical protein
MELLHLPPIAPSTRMEPILRGVDGVNFTWRLCAAVLKAVENFEVKQTSALGHKRTFCDGGAMSAFTPESGH